MRCLPVSLALLLALPAGAAGPPATVLSHEVKVTVDGSRRLREVVTWKVRIDDPAAVTAGILAPAGLDGAMDGDAVVLEDVLVVPDTVEAGTIYTLTATRRGRGGPYSGLFLTAPDLPVEQASFTVSAPSWMPLTVWSDASGAPSYRKTGTRTATIRWTELPADASAQALWSTWKSWMAAGSKLEGGVDAKLVNKQGLGSQLGRDLDGASIPHLTDAAFQWVSLKQGPLQSWADARPAAESLKERAGSAVDRGVVLISMLREAGYEALPATYRDAHAAGAFPITVPAPAVLDRPVIAVEGKHGRVWIDPGNPSVAVPELPAAMVGASAWVPGDLPTRLAASGASDGHVEVSSELKISADGAITFSASLLPSGAATEALRRLLAPLDDAGRTEALKRLVDVSHPGLERFTLSTSGVRNPHKPLSITLNGQLPGVFSGLGPGLRGTVVPVLGPALTGWLPSRIVVDERMAVQPPAGMMVAAVQTPPPAFQEQAMVARHVLREGGRLVLSTESQRPGRVVTPQQTRDAAVFLEAEAAAGSRLVLFASVDGKAAKALRTASSLSAGERVALEAMVWYTQRVPAKARKALKKGLASVSIDEVATALDPMVRRGDAAPWQALATLVEAPADLLRVAESLHAHGLDDDAWQLAAGIPEAAGEDLARRALLLLDLQPSEPPATAAEQALWRTPAELLAEAEGAVGATDPRVLLARGEQLLAGEQATEAEVALESALEASTDAVLSSVIRVRLAQAGAASGLPLREVQGRIHAAVQGSPFNAAVAGAAAEAMREVGAPFQAEALSLTSARLGFDDPSRWSQLVDDAFVAGDLATALVAAERASDLDPSHRGRAEALVLVARLTDHKELAAKGYQRLGEAASAWPDSLEARMEETPPEALLGLLQYHDADVVSSPIYLEMRAQMRLDQGLLDGAARDGVLLAERHGMASGTALAFAATAGRLWSSLAISQLNAAASKDLVARLTRMEHRLITLSGDAGYDARALAADEPRAEILKRTLLAPAKVAAEVDGWPELPNPSGRGPSGFRYNALLSKVRGVTGWSDPVRELAFLRLGGFAGMLPPPLANLYTPAAQPILRLADGSQVVRLSGGIIPLYAAMGVEDAGEVIGLGYTPEAAARALTLGRR